MLFEYFYQNTENICPWEKGTGQREPMIIGTELWIFAVELIKNFDRTWKQVTFLSYKFNTDH